MSDSDTNNPEFNLNLNVGTNESSPLTDEQIKDLQQQEYIGDGVYVSFDGYHIWLTTSRGYEYVMEHKIALEPQVIRALGNYLTKLNQRIRSFIEANKNNPFSGTTEASKDPK
jgi:hypothetical protein